MNHGKLSALIALALIGASAGTDGFRSGSIEPMPDPLPPRGPMPRPLAPLPWSDRVPRKLAQYARQAPSPVVKGKRKLSRAERKAQRGAR